jgi:hypothetical protein
MPLPKLSSYDTYDDAANDFEKTNIYRNLAPADRVTALDRLKHNYGIAQLRKAGPAVPNDLKQKVEEQAPDGGIVHRIRNAALEMGAKADKSGFRGLPFGKGMEWAASLLPDSNAQAAIDAVMLASMAGGGGEAAEGVSLADKGISMLPQIAKPIGRFAARVAEPIIAGAFGGATEGNAKGGAELGGMEGLGGEALAFAGRGAANRIQNLDLGRLSNFLERQLGTDIGRIRTPEEFDAKIRGGEMLSEVKNGFRKTVKAIDSKMKKTLPKGNQILIDLPDAVAKKINWPFHQPYPAATMTEANAIIDEIEDTGWDMSGRARNAKGGEQARMLAVQAEDDLAEHLEKQLGKGAMTDWLTGRNRLRLGKTMDRLLKESGIDKDSGLVDWKKLQMLAATKYRKDLLISTGVDASELSGVKTTDEFLDKLYRGADHARTDTVGSLNAYGRILPIPYVGARPKLTSHAGDIPYQLGRGRALTAALIMGPYRAVQFVKDLAGINENEQNAEEP